MINNAEFEKYLEPSVKGASAMRVAQNDFSLESLTEGDLQIVYGFVDKVPIQKTKKNLNRDFADCRLMA